MEKEYILWETDHWKVILAEDQTYLGRSVIILTRHPCTNLSDISTEELYDLQKNVILPYEKAVKKAFGAELFNWACLMNNAYQHTPPDPHMHWHVWPRYRHPVTIDTEEFRDTEFGYHYIPRTHHPVSPNIQLKILQKIKENL